MPSRAKILEDGSGTGAFILAANQAGLNARGMTAVRAAARLYGLYIEHCSLGAIDVEPSSADAIASFNLLSHIYHPWEYLHILHKLLKPGGQPLIRTGDRSGIMKRVRWGHWSAPEHVFHYSRKNLVMMFKQVGFEVVKWLPAFDSDFPYLIYDFSRKVHGLIGKLTRSISSILQLAWTVFRFPKDDVYILLRK